MSTSPSWFDQEKFSRLVKNLGPKAANPPAAAGTPKTPPRSPEKDTRRLLRVLGNTGPVSAPPPRDPSAPPVPPAARSTGPLPSHVPPIRAPQSSEPEVEGENESGYPAFPAPMPVPEVRSVSPLARRTTSLPNLKPIFEYEKPEDKVPEPEVEADEKLEAPISAENFSSGWPAIGAASTVETAEPEAGEEEEKEGEEIETETESESEFKFKPETETAESEDAGDLQKELDDARREVETLRAQLSEADEIIQASAGTLPGGSAEELTRALEERDSSRRDYANLREEFENFKKDQVRLAATKSAALPPPFPSQGGGDTAEMNEKIAGLEKTVDTLKGELDAVQGQINQSKDETSVAQRGLALSQKALQETREALREASEGFSQSKTNLESLRSECSSLVQQNLNLQSQNEQLSRELNTLRPKG